MTTEPISEAPAGQTPAPEPRWLTAEERATWLSIAGLMTRLPGALDQHLQRAAGVSFFEYMVMAMLSEQPQRVLRMSQLAELTNGSLSRLSHVVSRLEKQGWVSRAQCPEDGRYTNAHLTEAGWEKVVATAPTHVENVRSLVIDALTPEQLVHVRAAGQTVLHRIDGGTR